MIRVMRLWKNGATSAVWTGYNWRVAVYWTNGGAHKDGRIWIEDDRAPSGPSGFRFGNGGVSQRFMRDDALNNS